LVTGLSKSPLVISLLMALATLPALLPLQRRSGGYAAQLVGVVGLIGITVGESSLQIPGAWLVAPALLAVLLFAFGREISQLPLQRQLLGKTGATVERLRIGSEIGAMAGNLLEAFIFPALAQFASALVLLLPLGLSSLQTNQPLNTTTEANSNQTPDLVPFSRRCGVSCKRLLPCCGRSARVNPAAWRSKRWTRSCARACRPWPLPCGATWAGPWHCATRWLPKHRPQQSMPCCA
jgi:hypothetical protein